MKKNRLYVSGLWIIPGNSKRSPEHYYNHLDETFKMIRGERLMFFYETDEIAKLVSDAAQTFDVQLQLQQLDIKKHPNFDDALNLTKLAKSFNMDIWAEAFPELLSIEKGFNQYYKFLQKGQNSEAYAQQLVCTLGKYSLMQMAIAQDYANEYVWMDSSASRFNAYRKKADFTQIKLELNRIYHYRSSQQIFGRKQEVQGSVLLGTRSAWESFNQEYAAVLSNYIDGRCNYPATDEVLMTICKLLNPSLFEIIDKDERRLIHRLAGRFLRPFRHQLLKSMNYHMK